jgi:arylsulfatase
LLVLLLSSSCGDEESVATAEQPAELTNVLNRVPADAFAEPRTAVYPRILLITLDTLRADHLGPWGYPLATSPFLDSIAAESVVFRNAFAPMATTAPSHASILTGLYPLQHRVTRNGHRLSEEVVTLAEILEGAGFETGAVVSTDRHFGAAGIVQGFDFVDEPDAAEQRDRGTGSKTVELSFRPAERTLRRALSWLVEHQEKSRQFLWIHLFDAHGAYVPRAQHEAALGLSDPAIERRWKEYVGALGIDPEDAASTRHYRDYDTAIRYIDSSLEAFFAEAAPLGLDDFLLLITADHGEGLGDRGWWGHGKQIYNEQIHVPLIVRWPDRRHQGRIDNIVELTDLMPTILWAAGVTPADLRGRTMPLEGMPLQFLLERRGYEASFNHAFSQRRSFATRSWFGKLIARWTDDNYEIGEKFSLLDTTGKYIYQTELPDEYYPFAPADLLERQNAIELHTGQESEMLGKLLAARSELEKMGSLLDEGTVDPETIDKLRSLGYVQ